MERNCSTVPLVAGSQRSRSSPARTSNRGVSQDLFPVQIAGIPHNFHQYSVSPDGQLLPGHPSSAEAGADDPAAELAEPGAEGRAVDPCFPQFASGRRTRYN